MKPFIVATLVASLAAPGSLAQTDRLPRVGWVVSTTAQGGQHLVEAIRAGLADEGFVDGHNVVLDVRFLDGRTERYAEVFADLMRTPVNALAAAGLLGIAAARDASGGRIPVSGFFCGNDVNEMVATFARPGGNITGVSCLSAELAAKRVEFLHQAMPKLRRLGLLYDAKNRGKEKEVAETREVAQRLGIELVVATAGSADELPEAFAALHRARAEALVISEDPFTFGNRARIIALANEAGLPNISAFRDFVSVGGLMSYGASVTERLRHQARYVGRMLKGAKPSDLPIDQATRFEFVISMRAARAFGLTLPQALLLRADQLIE